MGGARGRSRPELCQQLMPGAKLVDADERRVRRDRRARRIERAGRAYEDRSQEEHRHGGGRTPPAPFSHGVSQRGSARRLPSTSLTTAPAKLAIVNSAPVAARNPCRQPWSRRSAS